MQGTPPLDSPPSSGATAPDGHPIVFFDGVCGLCNASVNFWVRHDRRHVLRFAPLQGTTAREVLHLEPDGNFSSMILWDNGREFRQSDAIWRVLRHVGGGWSLLGQLLRIIPKPLRNAVYHVIAQHRYQWFGKKESCRVPRPDERALFLP